MSMDGYMDGYLHKEAEGIFSKLIAPATGAAVSGTANVAVDTFKSLLPLIVAAPLVMGAGAGYAHSTLTSPTDIDLDTAQAALTSAELDEMLTNMRRRKEKALMDEKRTQKRERTLHI